MHGIPTYAGFAMLIPGKAADSFTAVSGSGAQQTVAAREAELEAEDSAYMQVISLCKALETEWTGPERAWSGLETESCGLEIEWSHGDSVEWSPDASSPFMHAFWAAEGTSKECVFEVHDHEVRQADGHQARHADG
jgi:hypothetical protein